jgi:hypothetical protein
MLVRALMEEKDRDFELEESVLHTSPSGILIRT